MQFSLPIVILLVAAAAFAGLLIGRNNPSLVAAADKLVKAGEAKLQAFIADAKAKLK